jgi:hypothetical protein
MTGIRKYKTLIAVVLLMVYAFIATPVQLWHHHNYKVSTATEKSSKQKAESTFSNTSQQATDTNCEICSHHYSIYSDITIIVFDSPSPIFKSNKGHYLFSIPSPTHFNFSNKGPPALS